MPCRCPVCYAALTELVQNWKKSVQVQPLMAVNSWSMSDCKGFLTSWKSLLSSDDRAIYHQVCGNTDYIESQNK